MDSIFNYYDYHRYLRDAYEERRGREPRFSFRYIGRRVGIDPGYLVKVLQGQKNIAMAAVPKFVGLLGLNKREAGYFELLVLFGKAKTNEEVTGCFERMLPFARDENTKIEADCYEFYKKWYYSAVREIIGFYAFKGDYKELAAMVRPPIMPKEAKKAVALLERLGLIRRDEAGVYTQTSRFITTGERWRSIAIRQFQEQTLALAKDALAQMKKDERDISTLTVSVSKECFERIREQLYQLRRRVFEMALNEQNADGAYQLNLQLFPVSRRTGSGATPL
jgi:uncharacterized protein (TIGR02147 family)